MRVQFLKFVNVYIYVYVLYPMMSYNFIPIGERTFEKFIFKFTV